MKYTQFLVFEICRDCNLAAQHEACPSAREARWSNVNTSTGPLDDETIISCATRAYQEFGFAGHVAFHYYNEPMLQWDRIRSLITAIIGQAPQARFTLWTNGTLLNEQTPGLDLLDQIWVTNYQGRDFGWLRDRVARVAVFGPHLDGRLHQLDQPNESPCLRPFNELIIDYHGNGRLCCMDWQGKCQLGNVFVDRAVDGFEDVVGLYRFWRGALARQPWIPQAPDVCRYCIGRQNHIADLVPSVQEITNREKPWLR